MNVFKENKKMMWIIGQMQSYKVTTLKGKNKILKRWSNFGDDGSFMSSKVELSDNVFAVLTTAVNLAKQHQCATVDQLKKLLVQHYLDSPESIDETILFWGKHVSASSVQ